MARVKITLHFYDDQETVEYAMRLLEEEFNAMKQAILERKCRGSFGTGTATLTGGYGADVTVTDTIPVSTGLCG